MFMNFVEKELTDLRLSAMKGTLLEATGKSENDDKQQECTSEEEDVMKQLESQLANMNKTPRSNSRSQSRASEKQSDPPRVTAADIIQRFTEGMEMDRSILVSYSVTSISKAPDNKALRSEFEKAIEGLQDPSMVTELYWCGSLERPNRIPQILKEGFKEEDFTCGEFGRGLYFSKYPSKAAQFSDLGKLLEVKVALGKVETAMRYDRTRKGPSKDNDSIITPGRLYKPGDQGETALLSQEYVVFSTSHLLPVCVIFYSAHPGSS